MNKLKKIIEYAAERGWKKPYRTMDAETVIESGWVKYILFDHDFAKAVFGEGMAVDYTKSCPHCGGDLKISNPTGKCSHIYYPEACDVCSSYYIDWIDHLQQAVISKDPIDYYYKYIRKLK